MSPLEVWNLPVLGHELWELLGAPRVDADRRAGVPEDQLAERMMPALTGALKWLVREHVVDAVWLSGGLACLEGFGPAVAKATATLGCPIYIAESPRFAPVLAGLDLPCDEPAGAWSAPSSVHIGRLSSPDTSEATPTPHHHPVMARDTPGPEHSRTLALDVGQTSLKCASTDALRVFERDTTVLPRLFIGMPRPTDGHHIIAAVRFIGGALRTFVQDTGTTTPDRLCLALPCPLDDSLMPGGCTYGWEGHASLVADILKEADLTRDVEVLVLNDAELAAEAARRDVRLTGLRRVLCLTLGFGPGGALLHLD